MPFHSEIAPHLNGPTAWAAWLAFAFMAGRTITRVVRPSTKAGA